MRVRSGAAHQTARETAYRSSTYIDIEWMGNTDPTKTTNGEIDALTYINDIV